jgi:CheY-like chemotaxis protein
MPKPKYRVLWIEDDPELLRLSRLILSHKGYDVIAVNDSRNGVEMVRREKPDVIMLDLMMPNVDGWEIYNHIKADPDLRSIPVIIVTAKARAADKAMAVLLAKVDGYLVKPYEQTQLLDILTKVLSRRSEDAGPSA